MTDAEIFQALDTAWKHGWQKVKMYFMIGLPGETMADIEAIALLLEKILAAARARRGADHDPCFLLLLRSQAAYAAAVGGAGHRRRPGRKGGFFEAPG